MPDPWLHAENLLQWKYIFQILISSVTADVDFRGGRVRLNVARRDIIFEVKPFLWMGLQADESSFKMISTCWWSRSLLALDSSVTLPDNDSPYFSLLCIVCIPNSLEFQFITVGVNILRVPTPAWRWICIPN